MSILYSAIGKSDPIRSDHDGPWLHICRVERPTMTMIYLSGEMCKKDANGAFDRTIQLLNAHLGISIALQKHKDPDMTEAHEFEPFIDIFRKDLDALHAQYPEEELLINVSSGTAGMKTALVFLANLLPYPVKTIQVSNPWHDRESDKQVGAGDDFELAWEANEDNSGELKTRTIDCNWQRYSVHKRIDTICHWVENCQYQLAYESAKEISVFLMPEAFQAIEGAWNRYLLKTKVAGMLLNRSGLRNALEQNCHDVEWQIAEYLLMMRNKARHGEASDVLRCMTPALCRLCELALDHAGKPITGLGAYEDSHGSMRWDVSRMPKEVENALTENGRSFNNNTFVATENLLRIMKLYCTDPIINAAQTLRDIELAVRNEVAHRIISCGDNDIKERTRRALITSSFTSSDIVEKLYELFKLVANTRTLTSSAFWKPGTDNDDYAAMNKHIIDLLQKSATC